MLVSPGKSTYRQCACVVIELTTQAHTSILTTEFDTLLKC
jgi:hypothetical protein